MSFQHLSWLYVAVPLLIVIVVVRYWRRHYWGHSLVDQLREDTSGPNPILRLPTLLEGLAVVFLLMALLGPVYSFVFNRIERGGLRIMMVFDLSQSMEEPLVRQITTATPEQIRSGKIPNPTTKMEAVKATAVEFIKQRSGDAIGLVVFSNNGYLVAPATFDHESTLEYLSKVNTQSLVNEGFTAIGEGLFAALQYFDFTKQQGRQSKGQIIVLFSDGDSNFGTDPLKEIEKARGAGVHVYFIGVALEPGASQAIADNVPSTGGQYFDVRNPNHLKEAMAEINKTEKGRFTTIHVEREEPAYFIFVLLAFACLALRMVLHAIPNFVELS